MGFLRRLFGGGRNTGHVDKNGIYIYVKNTRCDAYVRLRIDKIHDLNRNGNGFVWHKTIVDNKCYQQMRAVVEFDSNYAIVKQEIDAPGEFISEEAYTAGIAEPEPEVEEDASGGGAAGFE